MWIFGKKKDVAVLVSEGHSLLQSGKTAKALARFKAATEADPTHAEAWYCLGTIYSSTAQFESAIDCYQKSAQHAPLDRQSIPLFNMGNALQSLGKVGQALEVFKFATSINPEFADAWINQGRLLDDAGRHLEAIDCYDKALAIVPDDVTALSNRGNSLRALKRFDDAKASYEAALAIDPGDLAGLVGLGVCLSHLGQPEEGLRLLDKSLNEAHDPPVLVERATVLTHLNRHDEALASIDEAIHSGLRRPEVYNNRAEILVGLERVQEAIASFEEALKFDAGYAPALFGKARVLCNARMFGPAKATIDLYFKHADEDDGLAEAANAVLVLCRDAGIE